MRAPHIMQGVAATLLLAVGAQLVAPAFAAEHAFVSAQRTYGLRLLAAPPGAATDISAKELVELHEFEKRRTPDQIARAMADDKDESIFLFRDVVGERFSAAPLPLTANLSDHVLGDEGANTSPLKQAYGRVRPYNADKSLKPVCKTKTKDDSYPSGHATAGYLQALTLVDLLPEKRDAILARAEEYAQNRLVCGVHYRSDIEAGKVLAYAVHALMVEDPQYQRELALARKEMQQVLGTK